MLYFTKMKHFDVPEELDTKNSYLHSPPHCPHSLILILHFHLPHQSCPHLKFLSKEMKYQYSSFNAIICMWMSKRKT